MQPVDCAALAVSREEIGGYQIGRSGDEVDDSYSAETDNYQET